MRALEIIEQIQKLPPAEQQKIADFLRNLPSEQKIAGAREIVSEDFERIAEKVFTEHGELFRKLAQHDTNS